MIIADKNFVMETGSAEIVSTEMFFDALKNIGYKPDGEFLPSISPLGIQETGEKTSPEYINLFTRYVEAGREGDFGIVCVSPTLLINGSKVEFPDGFKEDYLTNVSSDIFEKMAIKGFRSFKNLKVNGNGFTTKMDDVGSIFGENIVFDCDTRNLRYYNRNSVVYFEQTQPASLTGDGYAKFEKIIPIVNAATERTSMDYNGVLDLRAVTTNTFDTLNAFEGGFRCLIATPDMYRAEVNPTAHLKWTASGVLIDNDQFYIINLGNNPNRQSVPKKLVNYGLKAFINALANNDDNIVGDANKFRCNDIVYRIVDVDTLAMNQYNPSKTQTFASANGTQKDAVKPSHYNKNIAFLRDEHKKKFANAKLRAQNQKVRWS